MWPYVAITASPSDGLLDTSDQIGGGRGEVKAGCCRTWTLGHGCSDQGGADEDGI